MEETTFWQNAGVNWGAEEQERADRRFGRVAVFISRII